VRRKEDEGVGIDFLERDLERVSAAALALTDDLDAVLLEKFAGAVGRSAVDHIDLVEARTRARRRQHRIDDLHAGAFVTRQQDEGNFHGPGTIASCAAGRPPTGRAPRSPKQIAPIPYRRRGAAAR